MKTFLQQYVQTARICIVINNLLSCHICSNMRCELASGMIHAIVSERQGCYIWGGGEVVGGLILTIRYFWMVVCVLYFKITHLTDL